MVRLPRAVVFDVDGLLVESEQYWDKARRTFVADHGGRWTAEDQRRVMGDNSAEWARYIVDHFGIAIPPDRIIEDVQQRLMGLYRQHVPVLPGALQTVRSVADDYSLAVGSA